VLDEIGKDAFFVEDRIGTTDTSVVVGPHTVEQVQLSISGISRFVYSLLIYFGEPTVPRTPPLSKGAERFKLVNHIEGRGSGNRRFPEREGLGEP